MINEHDLEHLRTAITEAWHAREHGNHPFGAVLVDANNKAAKERVLLHGADRPHHLSKTGIYVDYVFSAAVMSARCIQEMATSLRTNTSLKSLRMDPCSKTLHNEDKTVLLQLVEAIKNQNYTLSNFEMYTEGSRRLRLPELDFYLHCNHLQRGKILQSTPTTEAGITPCQRKGNEVIDFVIRDRTDTSTLFHILSEKPEVLMDSTITSYKNQR